MKIEVKPIDCLIAAEYNPRQISDEALLGLKTSLQKFGVVEPIVWNERSGKIVGGHQRIKALKALGHEECTVVVVNLNERDEKTLNVSLNNQHIQGGWDYNILPDVLAEIKASVPEYEDLALDKLEIEIPILAVPSLNGKAVEADEVSEEPAVCREGDVWELGRHRFFCGDSTNVDLVAEFLGDMAPALMVTDPPYGVEYDPSWREGRDLGVGKRSKGKVKNDDRVDWKEAYLAWRAQVAYVWHSDKYCHQLANSLTEAGFEIISQIIWTKQHFALSRGDYHWQHEPCWYVVKKGKKHNWQGARDQSTVWEIKNNNSFGNSKAEETWGHGTQKPMECMARPIRNNSKEGDLVVDPFLGSGTTLIAAEQLNRKCYGAELDPKYCDVIIKRWQKETGEEAVLLGDTEDSGKTYLELRDG